VARRREVHDVSWLIKEIDDRLLRFGQARSSLPLRRKVLDLCEIYEHTKDLGVSAIAEDGLVAGSGIERIRLYLVQHVEIPIQGIELEVVAGIPQYARRVRQLRKEQGYQIATGASPDPDAGIDLRRDQYLLIRTEPDADAARRWHIANRIRRSEGGSKARILMFLRENVGTVVTTEELAYVAKEARQFARRLRQLRSEDGYSIATRFTGRPDLRSGQYVLESESRRAEPHDRRVTNDIQKIVYERDKNACRLCQWSREDWSSTDPRILELHHMKHHQDGGPNEESNLVVLCSRCHDEIHAGRHRPELEKLQEWLLQTYSQKDNDGQ
jgi:HNH endonuclease